uniref:Uncharacterized protein n=1 Tax=Amphimedon queenslandica TaxID=400682 RepID=A0A1X7T676_AMPQE
NVMNMLLTDFNIPTTVKTLLIKVVKLFVFRVDYTSVPANSHSPGKVIGGTLSFTPSSQLHVPFN